jgi:hypothetical protein
MAGDKIGLPYPPASLAPTSRGPAILRGLNYASGAAGILDGSGANYVRYSFFHQILYEKISILIAKLSVKVVH